MTTSVPCREISATIGQLFHCSEVNGFVCIRTPYLYPDGDIIDLFYKTQGEQQVLTDLGETLRWLITQSATQHLSKKQDQAIQDIKITHGVELFQGALVTRKSSEETLAETIMRLAQAVISVSNLYFLFRTRTYRSISDEIAELLREKKIRFQRSEKLLGRSGRSWRLDFHTWHPERTSLVQVLSTGSKAVANARANSVLAAWHDLSQHKLGSAPLRFVSLFDDTLDVWTTEIICQLEELSDAAYWSQPEDFVEILVTA